MKWIGTQTIYNDVRVRGNVDVKGLGHGITITNTSTSHATAGGILRLRSDDGAALGDDHRLGSILFGAAEDGSSNFQNGAKINAYADAAWSGSENGTRLEFYTMDGDASSELSLTLDSNRLANFTGNIQSYNTNTSSASGGGLLSLVSDDGAALGDDHRLGGIIFKGAEDGNSTLKTGAKINAYADAAWSNLENGTRLEFYTMDGDGSSELSLTLDSDLLATFAGAVTVGGTLTVDSVGVAAIQTSGESFVDNDTSLMTSAAIDDRINTAVTAEDLDLTADSGTAAVDLNSQALAVTGGTNITTSATGQAVTINVDDAFLKNNADDTTSGVISSAGLIVDGDKGVTPSLSSGSMIHLDTSTITDTNTSGSGTAAGFASVVLEGPTIASTNEAVAVTNAATLYIKDAVTSGENIASITNNYSIWADAGIARFDGGIYIGTTNTIDSSGNWLGASAVNLTTIGKAAATTNIAAGDLTMFNPVNDGNPTISLGKDANDRFEIKTVYNSGAQNIDEVYFSTYTTSSTSNDGRYIWEVDEVEIARMLDAGLYVFGNIQASDADAKITAIDTTASSATQGGELRLVSDDGAAMADNHRLGVIEFQGAEDGSATRSIGARIQAVAREDWDGSNNDADLEFYTTDGTTESKVLTLDADKLATFTGAVTSTGVITASGGVELGHASDTTIARSASGTVTIEGKKIVTDATQKQLTHHVFVDNMGTTKQYIGLQEADAENTDTANKFLPFPAITAGKLLKVALRSNKNLAAASHQITFRLESIGAANPNSATPDILGAQTGAGCDSTTMTTYDFTTGLDSGDGAETNAFDASDLVYLSIQSDTSFGANVIYYITCIWEWDLS